MQLHRLCTLFLLHQAIAIAQPGPLGSCTVFRTGTSALRGAAIFRGSYNGNLPGVAFGDYGGGILGFEKLSGGSATLSGMDSRLEKPQYIAATAEGPGARYCYISDEVRGVQVVANSIFAPSVTDLDTSVGKPQQAEGVAVWTNYVYVADSAGHRVLEYQIDDPSVRKDPCGRGGQGDGDDQLDHPTGVAVDDTGAIFVLDMNNHRVVKYGRHKFTGTTVAGGNGMGDGLHQLGEARGLALDANGDLIIADSSNNRVLRWTPGAAQGTLLLDQVNHNLHYPWNFVFETPESGFLVNTNGHNILKCTIPLATTSTFSTSTLSTTTTLTSSQTSSSTFTATLTVTSTATGSSSTTGSTFTSSATGTTVTATTVTATSTGTTTTVTSVTGTSTGSGTTTTVTAVHAATTMADATSRTSTSTTTSTPDTVTSTASSATSIFSTFTTATLTASGATAAVTPATTTADLSPATTAADFATASTAAEWAGGQSSALSSSESPGGSLPGTSHSSEPEGMLEGVVATSVKSAELLGSSVGAVSTSTVAARDSSTSSAVAASDSNTSSGPNVGSANTSGVDLPETTSHQTSHAAIAQESSTKQPGIPRRTTSTLQTLVTTRATSGPGSSSSQATTTGAISRGEELNSTTPVEIESMAKLVETISEVERDMVEEAFRGTKPVSASKPGMRMAAYQMRASMGDMIMPVDRTSAWVRVPASVLPHMGSGEDETVVCVLAVLDSELVSDVAETEGGNLDQKVESVMSMRFFRKTASSTTPLEVMDLQEPIQLILPSNRSATSQCAYWDESREAWSGEGVFLVESPTGDMQMACNTTHLSLFASIARGFVETLSCTHLNLLSAEGLRELLSSDWQGHPAVMFFMIFLVLLSLLLFVACVLDNSSYRSNKWGDEFFLIPVTGLSMPDDVEMDWSSYSSALENSTTFSERPTRDSWRPGFVATREVDFSERPTTSSWAVRLSEELSHRTPQSSKKATRSCLSWCKTSSALRDAFDDVASRWFAHFSEVRDFVERLCEGLQVKHDYHAQEELSKCGRWTHEVTTSIMAGLVCRQAAASLGVSSQVLTFLTESEDLQQVLNEAIRKRERGAPESDLGRAREWLELHENAVEMISMHWSDSSHSWRKFPVAMMRLFCVSNPMTSAFLACHFWTSSLRVLFIAIELLGAIVVATLFFQTSDLATSKRSRGACNMLLDPAEQFGRLLAIGLTSLLVANIPVVLMSSLHCRTFTKIDRDGSELHKRKLRMWRAQDLFLWVLGLSYCGFCALFMLLFLANVNPGALASWSLVGYASVVQDAVVIPLGVGTFVPMLSMAALKASSCRARSSRTSALRRHRRTWESRQGNWTNMVLDI